MASPDGLLIVNYGTTGRPIGVEITAPQAVPLARLNQLLADLGEPPLAEQDYQPFEPPEDPLAGPQVMTHAARALSCATFH